MIRENKEFRSFSYQFPGGESPRMFIERISKFIGSFEEKHGNEPFLIVTHIGAIKAMLIIAEKIKEEEFFTKKKSHEDVGIIEIRDGKIVSFDFL